MEAKLLRAIYSNRQLEEVLTDFWYNHFNVFLDKGADRYLVTSYERDVIRPHVLGKVPGPAAGHRRKSRRCCSIWIICSRWIPTPRTNGGQRRSAQAEGRAGPQRELRA